MENNEREEARRRLEEETRKQAEEEIRREKASPEELEKMRRKKEEEEREKKRAEEKTEKRAKERAKRETEARKHEEKEARRKAKEEKDRRRRAEKETRKEARRLWLKEKIGGLKTLGGKINLAGLKKRFPLILLGILIVAIILSRTMGRIKEVFFGPRGEAEKEAVEMLDIVPVKVYKVKRMDFKDTLPVMGRVEGFKEIELRFDGKGVLESFNFEEGERILEGDIIASLDQKDALLKLKYAALEMEKADKLYKLGGIEKMVLDQKKLEYESAKRDLEKTNIYAPSDGYLASKEEDTGAFVTSQDKIGTFVDFSEVYAAFDIIEEDSSKIELGQNVEIFFDAYPGSSYTGTVDTISPMIEGRTRTQKIKVELNNEKDELKPGMFSRAIINTYEKKDALMIPSSAFKKQENKYFVYVVSPEAAEETEEEAGEEETDLEEEAGRGEIGIVEHREIQIEYLTYDMAEVSEGIEEGELIIRELHREYKDKDRVEIAEIQETIF